MSRWLRLANYARSSLTPAKALGFIFHLPRLLRLIVRLLRDGRVPVRPKIYCALAVLYFLFPLDVIPEFLGLLFGIGFLDHAALLVFAFGHLVRTAPPAVVDEHVRELSRPRGEGTG